jgi:NADH-quinone oxidoreductase subunit M
MIAWTIYLTVAGAVLLLLLPRALTRWIALATAAGGFAIDVAAFFARGNDFAHFTTIVQVPWVPALGMNYHLAADGISLTLTFVTGLTAVCAVLFSWKIAERPNEFFFWLLLVVAGSYGVFLSADIFLFFVFYELVIVPKYFLIAIWGSTNKEYGAMKLTLYSFLGGALVFIGILAAYVTGGSLDLQQLAQFRFPTQLQEWAFPVLFVISVIVFAMMRMAPGDPVDAILGQRYQEEQAKVLKEKYGYDKPIYIQYLKYMENLAHGDLGVSTRHRD